MTRGFVRRKARWLAVLGMAPLIFAAACGGGSAGGGGQVDGSSIVLSVQNGLVPQFQKYVSAYEQQFPQRKITVQSLPDASTQYIQQLVTQRLGNQLPDVLMNVDYAANQLAAGGVTMDLAPWLSQGKDGLKDSSFLPQFLGQYRPIQHPGQITGLPVSADSTTLFYNKTLFQQAGVTEYPRPDWTWDDLYRVAAEIQQRAGGKFAGLISPLGIGDQAAVYNPVIHAYGGYVYDPKTNKSGIGEPAAVQAWTTMIRAYGLTSPAYSADQGSQPKFENGQAAMAFAVRANVPTFKQGLTDQWDVQTMPVINGKSTVGGGSYGLSIAQTSKNQNAAWAFLAWFYSDNGGMKLAQETGQVLPPTQSGLSQGSWRQVNPPANEQAFATDAQSAYLQAQLPGKAQGVLQDAITKALQQVVLQHEPIATAFGAAEETVNQTLQQSGS